jgi:formyl-CoA transferase
MTFPRASAALNRFTVLDLTRVRAGPTCVRQLADWGANCIKIEMPEHMADGEGLGGPREGSDFQNLHRNKRSITLNLKSPDGVAVLKKMAAKADVVVENYRPDVKARLGIDYAARRSTRLIYAAFRASARRPYASPPGSTRSRKAWRADVDHRPAGQSPVRVGIPVADLARACSPPGIMVALSKREVSGKGQAIDLAPGRSCSCWISRLRWLTGGESRRRPATTIRPRSTGVFKTTDGYINIAAAPAENGRRSAPAGIPRWPSIRTIMPAARRAKNRDASTPDRNRNHQEHCAHWSTPSTKRACRAGRSTRSIRPSRTASQAPTSPRIRTQGRRRYAGRPASRPRARRAGSWRRRPMLGETPTRSCRVRIRQG